MDYKHPPKTAKGPARSLGLFGDPTWDPNLPYQFIGSQAHPNAKVEFDTRDNGSRVLKYVKIFHGQELLRSELVHISSDRGVLSAWDSITMGVLVLAVC